MNPLTLATSLIKPFESLKLEAYKDPIGIPTIGYGTTVWSTGDKVQMGEKIDEDGAEQELWAHLSDSAQKSINKVITVPLAPHQMAALLSFVHNIGGDAEAAWPTLRDLINDGAPTSAIADQWVKYKNAAGSPLLGLYRRRVAEVLVLHNWEPEDAFSAVQGIGFDNNWRELVLDPLEIPELSSRQATIDDLENERTAELNEIELEELKEQAPEPVYTAKEAVTPAPRRKPPQPFEQYDPAAEEKDITFSKRVWGFFGIIVGWVTMMANALAEMPFVSQLASMSPLQVQHWWIGMLILMAGFLLHWYGKVKAKGPLR